MSPQDVLHQAEAFAVYKRRGGPQSFTEWARGKDLEPAAVRAIQAALRRLARVT